MTRLGSSTIGAVVVALALASPVAAQPTDQPETVRSQRPESYLDVTVDLFGAADRSLVSDDPVGERTYWGGNSQFGYQKSSNRFTFGADAGASVRRLSDVTEGTLPSYFGSLRGSGPLSRRSSWDIVQSFSYGPTNAVPFFGPGDPTVEGVQTVPLVDYRLNDTNRFTSSTRGSVGYAISRRGSLSATAAFEHAAAPPLNLSTTPEESIDGAPPLVVPTEDTSSGAFRRWEIGGRYSYRLSRYTSWYAGYGLTENSVNETGAFVSASPRMHTVDVGLAYSRPLSFSRRTRVSAQVGSAIVNDRTDARQWRANGNASLRHEIGRTWLARVGYFRNTEYLPAYAEPVMSDAVTFSIGGNVSQKASVNALVNYAAGTVGFEPGGEAAGSNNGYNIASTSATFRYAFLTQLAVYAEYFLFDADFDRGVALGDPEAIGSRRHGVRFGLSIGTGLWGNRRRMPTTPDGEISQ